MNLTANIMPRRTCDKHGWDGGGDCPWCEIDTLRKHVDRIANGIAALGEENAALRQRLEAAEKALREVERHHVELNAKAGRPESHSHTLVVVRAALAGEEK